LVVRVVWGLQVFAARQRSEVFLEPKQVELAVVQR